MTTLPAASVSELSVESRGDSWTSRPRPWPSPWPKVPANALALDHAPRRGIDVEAARAGADRVQPGLLRREHHVVGLAHLPVELAGGERPRVVGGVAADAAAGVDHDQLALPDRAVAGARVGPRTRRAGADDRLERLLLRPFLVVEPCDVPGDVPLAAADEPDLAHKPLEHPVRDRAGPPEGLELTVVLHGAQSLDKAGARHQLEPVFPQLLGIRPREDVRLEAEPAREVLAEPPDQRPLRLHRLDVLDGLRGLDVAEVSEEAHPVRLDEQCRVGAVQPGQVEDVDRVRDEERLLEQLPQLFDPLAHAAPFR